MPDLYGGIDDIWIDLDDIWQAWGYLDPYRDSGFNMGLIPLRAQLDYMEVFGVDDPQRFCQLIRLIDMEYLHAMQTEQAYVPSQDQVDDEALARQIRSVLGAANKK